tara:strand:+ start:244 stop:435 length:192 start_codon:yes stop_codon:yes gene_type:complete
MRKQKQIQIFKGCINRLDEVYSVIMTYGDKKSISYLDKLDDLQNHLEELFEVERDIHSNDIIN